MHWLPRGCENGNSGSSTLAVSGLVAARNSGSGGLAGTCIHGPLALPAGDFELIPKFGARRLKSA